MSTLIIGALFLVALVALVALVFVLRGERNTTPSAAPANAPLPDVNDDEQTSAVTSGRTNTTPLQNVVESTTTQTAQAVPTQSTPPSYDAQDAQPMSITSQRTVPTSGSVPVTYNDPMDETTTQDINQVSEIRVHLNGQFYELANSLRSLRQQAAEMEQRLNALTDMIDTIERRQS